MKVLNVGTERAARDRGIALVYACIAVLIAAGMVAVASTLSITRGKESRRQRAVTQAEYLAEGAIESAKKDIITAIANFQPAPEQGTVTIDGHVIEYSIEPTGYSDTVTDDSGIQTIVEGHRITAATFVDGYQGVAWRILNSEATPVFQFAVFYANDLEILPGPDMTLGGRVHTNADMYVGCGGTLKVDTNYMRAVGDIYRRRKDDPTQSDGEILVRRWVVDPYDPSEPEQWFEMLGKSDMDSLGIATTSGWDSDFTDGWDADGDENFTGALDYFPFAPGAEEYTCQPTGYTLGKDFTMKTGEHGITEAVTPEVSAISMFTETEGGVGDYAWSSTLNEFVPTAPGTGTHEKGFFHDSAGLSVVAHENGTVEAYFADGTDASAAVAPATTVKKLYDGRQGGYVAVLEIDVAALQAEGLFPDNGLLYSSWHGLGEGVDAAGVELTNGSELKAPLTVVSEGSVYLQGDYNTVGKKGAAVIGDSVNLLSNEWNDGKVAGSLPKAKETTFNVAMIAGNHDTVGSTYNGGLENLPRFHEDWSGVNCNIAGSFVNTWTSEHATGKWFYGGDVYTAPNRNWWYDKSFNKVPSLPPFTPMAVTAQDVVAW